MAQSPGSGDRDEAEPPSPESPSEALTPAEFETMVSEIHRPLLSTALRLTRSPHDAEDLVQEALFRAFRSLKSFRKGSRFKAWMFRILHNAFINRIRRASMAPKAVDPTEMSPADHDHPVPDMRQLGELPEVSDRHFDERVKEAVDELPEVFRAPLVLFSLADLSYQEIADVLEIPIGTVMSRLHRARKHMRRELLDYAADRGVGVARDAADEGDA